MTIRGLQRLLVILGGKVAAEFRQIVEETFTRVMAGDQSLIEVINANAASQAPVQQAYRAALAQEPVATVMDEFCLGKKRGRKDLLFDMKMAERKLAFDERKLQHDSKLIEHVNTAMRSINALKDLVNVDERTKLRAEEHIKNALFNNTASSGTDEPITVPNTSIPAKETGCERPDQPKGPGLVEKNSKIYQRDRSDDPLSSDEEDIQDDDLMFGP